jgi:hypothetical protein
MKLTRNLAVILGLATFTFAFAGEAEMGSMHNGTKAATSQEMKDCGSCKNCAKGDNTTPPPKVVYKRPHTPGAP